MATTQHAPPPEPAYDADQILAAANPECVRVRIGGKERPFLLSIDGFERAMAAGTDPMPALGRLLSALWGSDAVKAADTADGAQMAAAFTGALTSASLADLAVVVWAGLLPFDRELTLAGVKGSLTPGALLSILTRALPKVMAFATAGGDEEKAANTPEGEPRDRPN